MITPARQFAPTTFALALGLAACSEPPGESPGSAPRPPQPTGTRSLAEFTAVADRLEASGNRYFGTAQIPRLESELARPDLPIEARVNTLLQLAWDRLRLGETAAAIETLGAAFDSVNQAGGSPTESMFRLRLAYLRQAELTNCVARHNRECCLFPLAGGGVHVEKAPAANARRALLDLLAVSPNDLEAGWLLNLTAMALGNWPDDVPERFRIPESAFGDGHGIPRFTDIAGDLGVDPLDLAGGAVLEDFDNDGRLDIATSTYEPRGTCKYFRQRADGSFTDATASSGLSEQLGCALNCVAADYDNDGTDLLVLRGAWLREDGQVRNSLMRNNGDGTFTDVTRAAGLAEPAYPTQTAAWGDFDNDGDLDLFVGNESNAAFDPADTAGDFPSQLFQNNGDGTFSDVAPAAGVTNDRYCKGVAAGDFDNDGDLDLYVSNNGPNRLYRNDGGMKFTDVATEAGVTEPAGQSFATWFFDHDNDGDLDLFVAAYQSTNADVAADILGLPHNGEPPRLYENRGDATFVDIASAAGLNHAWLPMGANFGDLDNDGFLDLYLTTGRPDFAALMPNVMLRNDRGQRFENVTVSGGFGHLQKGHGVAFGDFDNDGDQDVYHQLGGFFPADQFHNALFENPGGGGASVTVKLIGKKSNRQAVGARVRVDVATPNGTASFHRAAGSVSSFGGSPSRLEIGLGDATVIESIEVRWPASGTVQHVTDVPLGAFITVTEGVDGFER